MGLPWSGERTDMLRKMFAAGWSDREIAKALAVTPSAVIGKRYRLDLFRNRAQREREEESKSVQVRSDQCSRCN